MNEIEAVGAEAALMPTPALESTAPEYPERPWLFGFLIAPSAVVANGVIQGGVLAFLLSRQGIGSGAQSAFIGLLALPTTLYFLWSPITDFFVRRRTWLLVGGLLAGLLMAVAFMQPNLTSSSTKLLMLASACFAQFCVSSCGGMMGALHAERSKRIASAFYQAGSLGFGAVSVSILLWISSRVSRDILGLVAFALIAGPAMLALAAPRQNEIATGTFASTMDRLWEEFGTTFWRGDAIPYILCMTFPMASGAAIGLLPGVAASYGLNGDNVAWMNGLLGGCLMAVGSIAATLIPARVPAPVAYLSAGIVNAATLAVLWLAPMRPSTYLLGVTLYLLTVGFCYGLFTAVVLDFLGASGKSGSGRYSIINSLGNIPVLYMLRLDGWGGDRFGPRGVAATECVLGMVGGTILLSYFLLRKRPSAVAR
jgi:PAT family beta-lactamase induction signal transducer AmpG